MIYQILEPRCVRPFNHSASTMIQLTVLKMVPQGLSDCKSESKSVLDQFKDQSNLSFVNDNRREEKGMIKYISPFCQFLKSAESNFMKSTSECYFPSLANQKLCISIVILFDC